MNTIAVFLDMDGTLIENRPVDRSAGHIRLLPGVVEGLRLLHLAGYALVVVTHQAGIAHGWVTQDAITYEEISLRIRLAACEIPLAGFYLCPHDPEGAITEYRRHCLCRTPKPGLLLQAACELQLDLEHSWMVGDRLLDVEGGRSGGCKTVLLTNGNETEWEMTPIRWPDLIADNVLEAAHLIMVSDESLTGRLRRPLESEED